MSNKKDRRLRHPHVLAAVAKAKAMGWTVEFKAYCEDSETPGPLLGHYGGVCVHDRKAIKVRTTDHSVAHLVAIIEHELEHANGAERGTDHPELGLRCGGTRNGFATMVNHPNRKGRGVGPSATPTTEMILRAREAAGQTQKQAGLTVHTSERSWEDWERGERRMHPAFWELYCLKTGLKQLKVVV